MHTRSRTPLVTKKPPLKQVFGGLLSGIAFLAAAPLHGVDGDEVVYGDPYVVRSSVTGQESPSTFRVLIPSETPAIDRDWQALMRTVPNLNVGDGGAGSFGNTFSIRGLANTPYFSDPAVTVYLDDLPLGSSFTYPANLASFSAASVLKGPQGTLFGRSGEAGVIRLESSPPGTHDGSELRAGAGNHGRYSVAASLRTATAESSDVSVNVWHQEQDGFITNSLLNRQVDPHNETGGTARLRFRAGEKSEFALQLFGQRSRNGAQPLVPLGGPLFDVSRETEGRTDIDTFGVALRGSFDLPAGVLTSVTSFNDWKLKPYESHLVLPPGIDSRIMQDQRTWNEELRFTGKSGESTDWVAGLWLSKSDSNGDVYRALTGLFPIEGSTFDLQSRSAAVFGQVSAAVTDALRLTAGLRLQHDKREFDRAQTIPYPGAFTASRDDDELLGKLELGYLISKETSTYASVSTGAKPGGYSAYTGNSGLAAFEPEHVVALETGLRNTRADGRLSFEASAFAWFIRDFQIERSFTQTDYIVVNAPRARSVGGELSADWRPADGWHVNAGLGVSIVTLEEFTDPFTQTDYSGNRAPYAPEFSAHLEVGYRDKSGWFASATASLTGRTSFDESEAAEFTQDSYAILGARAGYDAKQWRITAYADNVTDEEYYAFIVPGVYHGAPGMPRTLGAELTVRF